MPVVSAKQLYDYAKNNNLCCEMSKSWTMKHFDLIAQDIKADERVLTAFSAFYMFDQNSREGGGIYAYAITNKRFIIAQKKMIGSSFKTISLKNVNDITLNKRAVIHTITIDTIKEVFTIRAQGAAMAQRFYDAIIAALKSAEKMRPAHIESQDNLSAQLLELKKLLDLGLITQRDYDTKKNQILGI